MRTNVSFGFQFRLWAYRYEDGSIPAFSITSALCNQVRGWGVKGHIIAEFHSHVIMLDYVTFANPVSLQPRTVPQKQAFDKHLMHKDRVVLVQIRQL